MNKIVILKIKNKAYFPPTGFRCLVRSWFKEQKTKIKINKIKIISLNRLKSKIGVFCDFFNSRTAMVITIIF